MHDVARKDAQGQQPHSAFIAGGFRGRARLAPAVASACNRRLCGALLLLLLALVSVAGSSVFAAEVSSWNLRVAWGGGAARQWQGSITISDGTLGLHAPLGIEVDEPGSMWCEGGGLVIRQASPRTYDGLDLTTLAPADATLTIRLSHSGPAPGEPKVIEVPLQQLVEQYHCSSIDDTGNQLLIRRTPGDPLRIETNRPSLIFAPGEIFQGQLRPLALPVPADTKIRFKFELRSVATDEQAWIQHQDYTVPVIAAVGNAAPANSALSKVLPVEFTLPDREGVYNLVVEASTVGLRSRLGLKQVVSRRTVQMLVLSGTSAGGGEAPWKTVHEFDPANPSWLKRVSDLPLPGLRADILSAGKQRIRDHALGRVLELAPNSPPEPCWQAYPLSVASPGQPHILEIDFPSDLPQTLGISVLEAGPGRTTPAVSLDSGFELATPTHGATRWLKHRLVFWPRTSSPWVLLHNRRSDAPAVFGKVRLLAGPPQLPPRPPAETTAERTVFAYFDKPLFNKNFSGAESLDVWSGRALDDWTTFYQGGTRLVEYLRHLGYGGAMINVAGDGSAIYPSDILQPTPRFDTGAFFVSGQDVVRKDALEMLLQLFDRNQLKLIPAIDFSSTLPELEAVIRAGGRDADGLVWVGSDGHSWRERFPGPGPTAYYNPLHPRVQAAMLQVAREVCQRSAKHPSFQGLALQLSAAGYAQLPGADWGFDDTTIARFTTETGIEVPGAGPDRFSTRSQFLLGPQRLAWMNWRAGVMKNLYRDIRREVVLAKPNAHLVLAGGRLLDGPPWQTRLVPTLPQRTRAEDVLLELGLDARLHREPGLVLLRPETVQSTGSADTTGPQLSWEIASALGGPRGAGSFEGSLFHHPTFDPQVPSFASQTPFAQGVGWMAAHLTPPAEFNRRRFARHLAAFDSQMFFDGGLMLPLGQEESLSEFLAVLRELPATGFQTFESASQPVTVRTAVTTDRSWIYLVNDSPWRTQVKVHFQSPSDCQFQQLGLDPKLVPLQITSEGLVWKVEMEPFALAGGWFNSIGAKVAKVEVELPPDCRPPLTARLEDLAARAASLRNPPSPLAIPNRSFDDGSAATTPATASPIPFWIASTLPGTSVTLETSQPYQGTHHARLQSDGGLLTFASEPFATPKTGRFAVSVWLRTPDPSRQPMLRLAIDGVLNGGQYYRHAAVGAGERVVKVQDRWTQFIFQVHDLPPKGLTQLRVRFDLLGEGEVWVDEVQCFDLLFTREELIELSKLLTLAGVKLQNNEMTDCLRLLDGHWSRYLLANVPSPRVQTAIAKSTPAMASPSTAVASGTPQPTLPPPEPRTGFVDRMKNFVPRWMRF